MMVKMLDGVDSANGQEGQQYQAIVAKDATISGVLVPKGTRAVVLLMKGVGNNAWTLQLAAVVLDKKIMLVHGNSPMVVPMGVSDALTMGKRTVSTPTRIAVGAGLTVRFSVPGPLTPAPADVNMSSAPAPAQPQPQGPGAGPATDGGAPGATMPVHHGVGNDMFADRYRLTDLEAHSKGDNGKATVEPGEASIWPPMGGGSIWWEYTPPVNGKFSIDTVGSTADWTNLQIFVGDSIRTLVPILEGAAPAQAMRLEFQATAGQPYEIRNTLSGSAYPEIVNINIHLTPNNLPGSVVGTDNFADRKPLTSPAGFGIVDTQFFTVESGEPLHEPGYPNGNTAWWSYTPPANGNVQIDAQGSNREAVALAVYVGDNFQTMLPVYRPG